MGLQAESFSVPEILHRVCESVGRSLSGDGWMGNRCVRACVYVYVYIYVRACVCVCVCVWSGMWEVGVYECDGYR